MSISSPVQTHLNHWFQLCQRNFGAAPRSFSLHDRFKYLPMQMPGWAKKDDLRILFKNQQYLMREGNLVWGQIVQANNYLFMPGRNSFPASVIFPAKTKADFNPEILKEIANKVFSLKNTQPSDLLLQKVANYLSDEYDRSFGLFLPSNFCMNIPCGVSTIFIDRKHLPNGYLSRGLFPLVVSPREPKIATILPSKFWPSAMVDWWIGVVDSVDS